MSRKTLAEELAELANPAPTKEFDPDADIFGSGPALEASDDELLPPSKPKGKERSRLRGDIQLVGKEYSGRKSSRAAVFDQDDDQEGNSSSSEEEGEEDDEDEQEEEDSELENGSADEVASSSEEEEEEREEEEEDRNKARKSKKQNKLAHSFGSEGADAEEDDEAAALEREYREMQQQEADAMSGLQERASKERKKGLAVRAQRSLWESGLELRILLQKALQSGNRLPQPEGHRVAVAVDPELETGLKGLARDAAAVVDDLLGLLNSMEEQHPAIGEAAEAASVGITKRKQPDNDEEKQKQELMSDKLWSQLDESYQRFVPFRDAAIDRWHRKTVLASGSAARGGLKVLNQSVSSQVQLLMRDSQRVVERTRLPKRLCRSLCSTEEDQEGSAKVEGELEGADQGIVAGEEIRDPETFDDGEFYQTLLKEFFEGKQESGANWYSGPKQRKLVDRRASKGRKLRYHIHEKLANFMAPVELNAPQFASNIFANLFGVAAGRK
ncbi:hypothetical protein Ndes2526B_g02616 [Nannochloris sp. 'desiccata']|nr:hypothetical protein KSW81_007090 [Chlorella desiccata (nom. nud.)]KAH7621797.1 putative Protein AATF [Chlorella desiccata (nom. nud.)]